ncbi:DJ-1/PfpI family protein [Brevundimonas sp.]|uniref:DJ-1/PfpI family protein n=1 Tax=Brevundimonas sp. TaxID=1871086 RepID=UPI002D4E7B7A|nr:DJ-1/PfpI family protein [Brevundimonas sp.]HYD26337.1 DJ-1/PfpI family protein [Brevundimonas sp.]
MIQRKRRVAILIFDDVEVLDFAGPFEVFGVSRFASGDPAFDVSVVSLDGKPVRARNGLGVQPHSAPEDLAAADILVVPGGYGTRRLLSDPDARALVTSASQAAEATLSVCTGSLMLAAYGLLRGMAATTHVDAMDDLRALDPGIDDRPGARVVDNGRLLTSAGVSAGIDASLHLVSRFAGEGVAIETARYIQYDWRERGVDRPDINPFRT